MPEVYTGRFIMSKVELSRSEIANKTKEETERRASMDNYATRFCRIECTHCVPAIALLCPFVAPGEDGVKKDGDEIFWNTHKKFTY